jgi:hypothetical protein
VTLLPRYLVPEREAALRDGASRLFAAKYKAATPNIPIVFAIGSDPVETGLLGGGNPGMSCIGRCSACGSISGNGDTNTKFSGAHDPLVAHLVIVHACRIQNPAGQSSLDGCCSRSTWNSAT